jgi:hypothetical protein
MDRTGERCTTARTHVLREQGEMHGMAVDEVVEAAVPKSNARSARVRVLGQTEGLTVRAFELAFVASGQVVTPKRSQRWTWRGDEYGSGRLLDVATNVARVGLTLWPLSSCVLHDLDVGEYGDGEEQALAALWACHTGRPRAAVELDVIA